MVGVLDSLKKLFNTPTLIQPNFEKSHVTRRTRWYFRSTEFRLLNTTIADLPNRYSVKVFVLFDLYVSFGLSFSVPDQKSPGQ